MYVDGAKEYHENVLQIPECIINAVDAVAKQQDYIGQFIADCLSFLPDKPDLRLACTEMYKEFCWWWDENMKTNEKKISAMKTINKSPRERGFKIDQTGPRTLIYSMAIRWDISPEIKEFVKSKNYNSRTHT